MKLETYFQDDITIFTFTGELDAFNLPLVSKQIDQMIASGRNLVVLDLRLLTFINSSSLGYLIKVRKQAKAGGGDAVLASPSQFFRKLVATVGLAKMFQIFENSEEAVRHLEGERAVKQKDLSGDEADESIIHASTIIATVQDLDRARKLIGKLTSLYAFGVKFRWEIPAAGTPGQPITAVNVDRVLTAGSPIRVKFRQPFLAQNRYFDLESTVALVNKGTNAEGHAEAEVTVHFKDSESEDLKLIKSFVAELDALRGELRPGA